MSEHVFVVSEWLAKPGKEQVLWKKFKDLMVLSEQEAGLVTNWTCRLFSE